MPKLVSAASMTAAVALVGSPRDEHRHQRARGGGVVGRLRAGDPLDGALAELLGVLREPLLGDVGQEGRDLRAAGGQRAEREPERGAAQPRLPRPLPVLAAHPRPADGDDLRRPCGAGAPRPRGPRRGRRSPTATTTMSMPSASCGWPKVRRCWPVTLSIPTSPMASPSPSDAEAAQPGGAQDRGDGQQRQQHDGEVVGRAQADREPGHDRRADHQQRRADRAGDERADGGGRERLRGPARLGHLVALDGRHHRGRLPGRVEQDRGGGAAVHAAVVDAGEHDEGAGRLQRVGDRQQQRHGHGRADARGARRPRCRG